MKRLLIKCRKCGAEMTPAESKCMICKKTRPLNLWEQLMVLVFVLLFGFTGFMFYSSGESIKKEIESTTEGK